MGKNEKGQPSPDNSYDFGAPVGGSFWCTVSGLMKTAPAKQFRDHSAQSETGFGERLNRGSGQQAVAASFSCSKRRGFLLARIGAPLA